MKCYVICYKHLNKPGYKVISCCNTKDSVEQKVKSLNENNRKLGKFFYMETELEN